MDRSGGVTEYLQNDHERLDAILDEVRSLVSSTSFGEAQKRFAQFVSGLERHIDVEEEILFSAFEEMTGMRSGPTAVMRHEHVEIRRLLGAVTDALDRASAAAFAESVESLVDVLGTHNQKEERVLYPTTDRALGSEAAKVALVGRLRSILEPSADG